MPPSYLFSLSHVFLSVEVSVVYVCVVVLTRESLQQGSNPYSDIGCVSAMNISAQFFLRAVNDAKDLEVRSLSISPLLCLSSFSLLSSPLLSPSYYHLVCSCCLPVFPRSLSHLSAQPAHSRSVTGSVFSVSCRQRRKGEARGVTYRCVEMTIRIGRRCERKRLSETHVNIAVPDK